MMVIVRQATIVLKGSFMRLLMLIILSGCTSVFYQPTRVLYATPEQVGVTHEEFFFDSADGTRLHGWYLKHDPKQKPRGLVTFFHGNAQNLSAHFLNLVWLTKHGYDLFIFDYRGYGLSVGSPSPEKVNLDGIAALEKSYEFVQTRKHKQWIVHSQSLGGIITMRALEDFKDKDKIDLLVLDSTFDSYDDIAFDKLTDHWFTFIFSPLGPLLVSDEMAPEAFFKTFSQQVLVMHGLQDVVIPHKFGKRIFERLETQKKKWWPLADVQHINAFHTHNSETNKSRYLEELKNIETQSSQ